MHNPPVVNTGFGTVGDRVELSTGNTTAPFDVCLRLLDQLPQHHHHLRTLRLEIYNPASCEVTM